MIKTKILLRIFFIIVIFTLGITQTEISYGSCEYLFENETIYTCTFQLGVSVQHAIQLELLREEIKTTPGQQKNISVKIINRQNKPYSIEYYAFAYVGTRCVSCIESRDEHIEKITIPAFDDEIITREISIQHTGTYNYKFMYKEEGKQSWQELQGRIIVEGGSAPIFDAYTAPNKRRGQYIYILIILAALILSGAFFIKN